MSVLLLGDGAGPQARCLVGLRVGVEAKGLTLACADGWLGVVKVCVLWWTHSIMEVVCVVHSVRDLLSARGGGPGAFVSDLGSVPLVIQCSMWHWVVADGGCMQRSAGSKLGLIVRGALLSLLFDVHFLPLLDRLTV